MAIRLYRLRRFWPRKSGKIRGIGRRRSRSSRQTDPRYAAIFLWFPPQKARNNGQCCFASTVLRGITWKRDANMAPYSRTRRTLYFPDGMLIELLSWTRTIVPCNRVRFVLVCALHFPLTYGAVFRDKESVRQTAIFPFEFSPVKRGSDPSHDAPASSESMILLYNIELII